MRSTIPASTPRRLAAGSAVAAIAVTIGLAAPTSPAVGSAVSASVAADGPAATAIVAAASTPCKRAKRQLKRARKDLAAAQDQFRNGRGVRDAIEARQAMEDAEERISAAKKAKREHC